jgi:hypothetical protein
LPRPQSWFWFSNPLQHEKHRGSTSVSDATQISEGAFLCSFECCQFFPACPSDKISIKIDYGAVVEWYWQEKTEVLGENPVPMSVTWPP